MSIQMRPDYINPLSTMTHMKQGYMPWGKVGSADKVTDLQAKQQKIQNSLLLMNSTGTDSGISTEEQEEKLQAELEKVSEELRTARKAVPQEAMASSKEIIQQKRFDTYEAQPRQQSAGVYQVTHDEEGRQIIQVDKSWETAQEEPKAESQNEGEKPNIVKTTLNTDKVDKEIEKLKQTQAQLEQKIAAAKEPQDKETLETQLAQVEAELKLKDNDTYRRQHMEITEQKAVSKVGE